MALRLDNGIAAALKIRFGYEPGFPAERFDAERLIEFALAACSASVSSV
jgi:hypothetical protein